LPEQGPEDEPEAGWQGALPFPGALPEPGDAENDGAHDEAGHQDRDPDLGGQCCKMYSNARSLTVEQFLNWVHRYFYKQNVLHNLRRPVDSIQFESIRPMWMTSWLTRCFFVKKMLNDLQQSQTVSIAQNKFC
jgi:hypothetical protein